MEGCFNLALISISTTDESYKENCRENTNFSVGGNSRQSSWNRAVFTVDSNLRVSGGRDAVDFDHWSNRLVSEVNQYFTRSGMYIRISSVEKATDGEDE